eukprot:g14999.t1
METGEREGQPAASRLRALEADEMQRIRQIFERHHVPASMTGKELVDDVLIPIGLSKDDARAILCAVNSFDGVDVSYQDLLDFILPQAATASSEAELLHGPLVEETYDLEDPKSLAKYLIDADVRLVRAPYFYKLLRASRCMPRRQEAEHDWCEVDGQEISALVSHKEVAEWALGRRKALICSVSHAWETREHPDPCNFQLQNLVNCVWDAAYVDDIWVFYDYLSLFQFHRDTAEQEASFRRAMSNMHVMYAHQSTLTFRLECLTPVETWTARKEDSMYKVPIYHLPSNSVAWIPLSELMENFVFYLERGWCRAEIEWSAARGIPAQNIAIDCEADRYGNVANTKKVPTAPEVFEQRMATSAFTHRNDAATVVDLQRKIFHQKVTMRRHLEFRNLTVSDMGELAASLPHLKNLRVLHIDDFYVGDAEAKAFCQALSSLALQKLSLRFAYFLSAPAMVKDRSCPNLQGGRPQLYSVSVGQALSEVDVAAFASMTELDFFFWMLEAEVGDRLAQVIAKILKTNRSITRIDLAGNHISEVGLQAIADALLINHVVTHIGLQVDEGFALERIEERLKANRAAAEAGMDLSGGRLGDTNVQVLAEALRLNRSVSHIYLQNNTITDLGAKAIAQMLMQNTSIRSIVLRGNEIGDSGVEALAKALQQNRSIQVIVLQNNHIGDVGVEALAEAVRENDFILDIHLDGNPFGDAGCQAWDTGRSVGWGLALVVRAEAREQIRERCRANQEVNTYVKDPDTRVTAILGLRELTHRGENHVQKLVEDLKTDSGKTEINLQHKYIRDAQVQVRLQVGPRSAALNEQLHGQVLSEALKIHKNITHLFLGGNKIQDDGAQALAQVLKQNRSITLIDLLENEICDAGAEALAEAVQENDTIHSIILFGNPCAGSQAREHRPVSAGVARRCCRGSEAFRRIHARCSSNYQAAVQAKAAAAVKAVVEDLKTDGAKREIDLQGRCIEDAQVQVLSEELKIKLSITHIDLSKNRIKDAGAEAMNPCLILFVMTSLYSLHARRWHRC